MLNGLIDRHIDKQVGRTGAVSLFFKCKLKPKLKVYDLVFIW